MNRVRECAEETVLINKDFVISIIETLKKGRSWNEIELLDQVGMAVSQLTETRIGLYEEKFK